MDVAPFDAEPPAGSGPVDIASTDAEPPADSGAPFTDVELTELAMAADPDAPIDDDAVPFGGVTGSELLPAWYMPVPQAFGRTPRRMVAAVAIIGSLIVVNGVGLCVTYGLPEIAW